MTPALSRFLLVLILFLVFAPASVLAQQAARATLTGTVMDPNGAAVAGVKITATLVSAGTRPETVTNNQGLYVLTDLVPGEYELRAEAKGFLPRVTKAISLKVGQSVTLNISLDIGVTATVTLDEGGLERTPIDNTVSVVQGVVDSREVESLPLNGRNFLELALLIPGNAPAPNFDPTKTNAVVISSAGSETPESLPARCSGRSRRSSGGFSSAIPIRWCAVITLSTLAVKCSASSRIWI